MPRTLYCLAMKYIDAEKLKVEIDKLYGEYKDKFHQSGDQYHLGLIDGLDMAERVLDTLESEKPIGLEEEIHEYNKERFDEYFPEQDGDFISEVDFMTCLGRVARHFAEWGYLRAAEKYNEIEYNRQRAEESVPKDLEEAANKFAVFYDQGTCDGIAQDCFIAGAKCDRQQMMKEAVEGEITKDNRGNNVVRSGVFNKDFEYGDKVRVIVLPKND